MFCFVMLLLENKLCVLKITKKGQKHKKCKVKTPFKQSVVFETQS